MIVTDPENKSAGQEPVVVANMTSSSPVADTNETTRPEPDPPPYEEEPPATPLPSYRSRSPASDSSSASGYGSRRNHHHHHHHQHHRYSYNLNGNGVHFTSYSNRWSHNPQRSASINVTIGGGTNANFFNNANAFDPFSSTWTSSSSSSSSSSRSTNSRPTNYVHLSQNHTAIKETLFIDPCLQIPARFLTPMPHGMIGQRPNVLLETVNGGIKADVHIVGPHVERGASVDEAGIANRKKKTVMIARTVNGSVVVNLHDASPTRHYIQLSAKSVNGSVKISLPRSFNGLISAFRLHGTLKLSTSIESRAILLGDFSGTKQWFVGGNMPADWDGDTSGDWHGDELHLITQNGSMKICYEDEDESSYGPNIPSRFGSDGVHVGGDGGGGGGFGGFNSSSTWSGGTFNLGNFTVFGRLFNWYSG
ncbi:hypothetical protein AX16_003009 [Volvariella volvacea WC 439]|nr:hypothetical protein AX16_003009 [Volvariella volvacea WC 439]